MEIINLNGIKLDKIAYPFISCVFHRSEWETYCHSAVLSFKSDSDDHIARVSVSCKVGVVGKDKQPRFSEKTESVFLQADKEGPIVNVPLNSPRILEALTLNDWTKSTKTGDRMVLLGRAVKIEWEYAGNIYSCSFLPDDYYSPAMLCEQRIKSLTLNEKAEIRIALTSSGFKDNLFDM